MWLIQMGAGERGTGPIRVGVTLGRAVEIAEGLCRSTPAWAAYILSEVAVGNKPLEEPRCYLVQKKLEAGRCVEGSDGMHVLTWGQWDVDHKAWNHISKKKLPRDPLNEASELLEMALQGDPMAVDLILDTAAAKR